MKGGGNNMHATIKKVLAIGLSSMVMAGTISWLAQPVKESEAAGNTSAATLSVSTIADKVQAHQGDAIHYTVQVKNIASVNQTNVLLTGEFSQNLSYVAGSATY